MFNAGNIKRIYEEINMLFNQIHFWLLDCSVNTHRISCMLGQQMKV